jgi:hypothetical protein
MLSKSEVAELTFKNKLELIKKGKSLVYMLELS